MKIYLHPTPSNTLGNFNDSITKLKEAIDLIPVFLEREDLIYYPLHKLKNGRYMTYWEHFALNKGFISDSNYNTMSSIDTLFQDDIFVDELIRRVRHLEELLSKFHIHFKGQNSIIMAKLYTYGFLRLQGKLSIKYPKEFTIDSSHKEFARLLKVVTLLKEKLVQFLHNQIRDFNYPHNQYVKEVIVEYGGDHQFREVKTFALVDEEAFDINLSKIFRKLCPKFVAQDTEIEQLELVFSGSIEEIIPVKWVQSPNHLNYLLRGLKTKNKISNGSYFKLAKTIFVDPYGNPFVNLKNNHSIPQHAQDLDEIINLF